MQDQPGNGIVYKNLCALLSPRNSLRDILGALDFLGAMRSKSYGYAEVKRRTHDCKLGLFVILYRVSGTLAVAGKLSREITLLQISIVPTRIFCHHHTPLLSTSQVCSMILLEVGISSRHSAQANMTVVPQRYHTNNLSGQGR